MPFQPPALDTLEADEEQVAFTPPPLDSIEEDKFKPPTLGSIEEELPLGEIKTAPWLQVLREGSGAPAVTPLDSAPRRGADPNDPQVQSLPEFFFSPQIQLPRIKHQVDDSVIERAAKSGVNVAGEFASALSTPALAAAPLPALLAGAPEMTREQIKRVEEAEQTPPLSAERMEAGLSTVGLIAAPAIAHGLQKAMPRVEMLPEKFKPPPLESIEKRLPIEPDVPREPNVADVAPAEAVPPIRSVATERQAAPEHLRADPAISRLIAEASPPAPEQIAPKLKLKAERNEGGFVNPEIFQEVIDFGARIYRKGMDYAAWATQMVQHLGQKVGEVLQVVWDSLVGNNFLPNSREGGAFGSAGGKTKPLGVTPRGDAEFLRIPKPIERLLHGLEREGAADVIGRSRNKVAQHLAEATRRHVDTEQELFGNVYTTLAKPIQGENRGAVSAAFEELKPYIAAKENKRPLPAISPLSRKILTAWEDVAEFTGQLAAAHDVQVFDSSLGKHRSMRLIGRSYIPRMFRGDVQRVLTDPASDPTLWNNLVNEMAAHKSIPIDDAANLLRAEAGRFQTNDFMGNLEMARQSQLPEPFYEYDLRELTARYVPSFSERMAQIISYGQRLGPRDRPDRPNLWDVARGESADTYTQEWIRQAEDQAVNMRSGGSFERNAARAQTLASGMLLSSPTTSVMRNTFSGLASTAELMGVGRSIGTLVDTATHAQVRMDAREIGAVRDNIADFLHADKLGESLIDDAVRAVTDKLLKFSGYNGSEVFVRSHAALTASQFARDGVAAILRKPASQRAKEALGLFKRTGVDAEKIVAEAADWKTGPETRKFIRSIIRESQGGYRFDQVPLWANSNTGRFFYQFGRWGTQRSRNIWRNGVLPALGETVTYNGKTMTRWDPMPLIKMAAGTVLLGETFSLVASTLFDRDRRDASLSEIGQAWKEDERRAIGLGLERVVNDVITAGMLGIWSQPIDFVKGVKDQSRLRDPSQPPSLASVKAFTELGMRGLDQGGRLTRGDMLDFARGLVPGAAQLSDVARNIVDDPLYEAENDMRTLRNAARRWAKVQGLDVRPPTRGGESFRKSDKAPYYEPIKEALLAGDINRARKLKLEFITSQPERSKARDNLQASIKQSQPFRVGPYTAAKHYSNFRSWAQRNLSPEDYNQIVRVQKRYKTAAIAAGLW